MCWFCFNSSSGVGTILDYGTRDIDEDGLEQDTLEWIILFDTGIYAVYEKEIEMIGSAGRPAREV